MPTSDTHLDIFTAWSRGWAITREVDERFAIYDRIVTEPAHQRRGLGRAVMHALQAIARAHGRHANVLVASAQGRALYETLGWRLHAPWATAVIPGPDAGA